jgi:hypothetical protein
MLLLVRSQISKAKPAVNVDTCFQYTPKRAGHRKQQGSWSLYPLDNVEFTSIRGCIDISVITISMLLHIARVPIIHVSCHVTPVAMQMQCIRVSLVNHIERPFQVMVVNNQPSSLRFLALTSETTSFLPSSPLSSPRPQDSYLQTPRLHHPCPVCTSSTLP